MVSFEDHFSRLAQDYARYRPQYPAALFDYIASLTIDHDRAWDAGTGNGQATVGLAQHFKRVIATDPSANQVANAIPHERISYRVSSAEETDIESQSIDVVTAAQAIHWFDFDRSYAEAHRVLKPGGIIAAWCYNQTEIDPAIDRWTFSYYSDVLGRYWPPRIRYVDEHYRTLPFPFHEIEAPPFAVEARWELADLIGYLSSWSAAQRFIEDRGYDPLDEIRAELAAAWGSEPRLVRWPLHVKIGRTD